MESQSSPSNTYSKRRPGLGAHIHSGDFCGVIADQYICIYGILAEEERDQWVTIKTWKWTLADEDQGNGMKSREESTPYIVPNEVASSLFAWMVWRMRWWSLQESLNAPGSYTIQSSFHSQTEHLMKPMGEQGGGNDWISLVSGHRGWTTYQYHKHHSEGFNFVNIWFAGCWL